MSEISGIINQLITCLKSKTQLKSLRFSQGFGSGFKEIPLANFHGVFTLAGLQHKSDGFGGYLGKDQSSTEHFGSIIHPVILLELISPKTADGNRLIEYFELIWNALQQSNLPFKITGIKTDRLYYDRTVKGLVLPMFINISKVVE